MKEINKKHLQSVMETGDILRFKKELQTVLMSEVNTIDAPLQEKNKILDLFEYIEIPIRTCYQEKRLSINPNAALLNASTIAASVTGAICGTLTRRMPFIPAMLLSLGSAVVVGCLVDEKLRKTDTRATISYVETIDTPIEEVIQKVDKIINLVTILVEPPKVMLSDSFPNIIQWYQEAYSSCEEFGEKCSEYFKKRIEGILHQCYYTLHNYDGTNENLFYKTEDVNVQIVTQHLPAITSKTGYILPGNLFFPIKTTK